MGLKSVHLKNILVRILWSILKVVRSFFQVVMSSLAGNQIVEKKNTKNLYDLPKLLYLNTDKIGTFTYHDWCMVIALHR